MVTIQTITAFEDFHKVMFSVYRMESVIFRGNDGLEYRIAFLSYPIAECTDIIAKLKSEDLIEDFVEVNERDLLKKLEHHTFHQPLALENYIVYPISEGNTGIVKEDKGFQRKLKSLGYNKLPHVTFKKNGNYKIRFPERFIQSLHSNK